jgi:hypothetical protein
MSRSLRGLSQEGVREALSRNPRLRWVAKTVLRPLIDRLTSPNQRGPKRELASESRAHPFPLYDGESHRDAFRIRD